MNDDRPALEIEITSEMIEAGVSMLLATSSYFHTEEEIVERVFKAMIAKRKASSRARVPGMR